MNYFEQHLLPEERNSIPYFATGILNLEIAARALQLLPMMLIGLTAGIWTVKKVSPDWIRRAVILALIVSGVALIINNI